MSGARRVGILGASGLLGLQLVAMLHRHPAVKSLVPFSRSHRKVPVGGAFPAFHGLKDLVFADPADAESSGCDVFFLAMPHGESFPYARSLASAGATLIDLSADFRLADAAAFERVYGVPHGAPELLERFRLVVPEINGADLDASTKLVAVPGCTATAVILALYPLVQAKLLASPSILVDAKTSSSGAGNKAAEASQSHLNRVGGVRVHKLLGEHRHRHEIASFLEARTGTRPVVSLNTFAVDLVRGLSAAVYLDVAQGTSTKALFRAYRDAYGSAPCVRVIRLNAGFERFPNPKLCARTNFCDIGFQVDEATGKAVVVAALDNLLKGGAGQAVQCFNRLVGRDDAEGVPLTPAFP